MHTTTQRKVRKDFDTSKEYSVAVRGCTVAEKEEVQQAFFDAGISWTAWGESYQYPNAKQYTNTSSYGSVTGRLMYGTNTKNCNITAKEFLELVYEPEQQGHVHAALMLQYAEDAKTHAEPWKLWQFLGSLGWSSCGESPRWNETKEYRRKPKTHSVNGVEVPDLRVDPNNGESYYIVDPTRDTLTDCYTYSGDPLDLLWVSRRLCYEHSEAGKQAAILHAKAWLGEVL